MHSRLLAGTSQAGGASAKILVFIVLAAAAWGGYRIYSFYQNSVAPVVAGVSKLAGSLNPYKVTQDPAEVAQWLQQSFNLAPPQGYTGALGLGVNLLGQKQMQLMALIPQNARPQEIFEGGRNEIRFNPGKHTIFVAAQFNQSDPDEMREVITKLAAAQTQTEPLEKILIDAGGKKVAALRGVSQSYGAWNTVVFVFLDEGRVFFSVGPKGAYDERALQAALTGLVVAHPANELLYQHPKPEEIAVPSSDPCGIPGLSNDFDVVAVSASRGSTPLDVAIDLSGHDVAQEEVVVGSTPKPVVLLLMGYDPIVWNIGRTEGARIAGVLAQGVYRQAVTGLPSHTLMTSYSTADGPNACRYFRAERPEGGEYSAVQRRVKELFGRRIGTFLHAKGGKHFAVGEISGEIVYSPDTNLQSVALPENVMPGGKFGIQRLVKEGALRPATNEEVATWVKGAAARLGQPEESYRRRIDSRLSNDMVYVVLKPFDLPEGLAGANARTFILPSGAARPGGPQGHCTFLQMEGFQCYGVGCD